MKGCFVTAVDTGVGKTVVAAAIAARLRADGVRVAACKPVVTGLDEPSDVPYDHELLAACTGQEAGDVVHTTFGPAVSPHLAAALAGRDLVPEDLQAHARALGDGAEALVVEGVGGLLVPLTLRYSVCDHAVALGLPLVVVARPGLGTINHTLLTVAAARAAGLQVRAIVFNPWPRSPSPMEVDNAMTITARTDVPTYTLARLDGLAPDLLADAAAAWPVDRWVA